MHKVLDGALFQLACYFFFPSFFTVLFEYADACRASQSAFFFFSGRFTEIGSGDPFPAMRLFQGTSFPLVMACMMVVIKFLFKISFLLVCEVAQGIKM